MSKPEPKGEYTVWLTAKLRVKANGFGEAFRLAKERVRHNSKGYSLFNERADEDVSPKLAKEMATRPKVKGVNHAKNAG